ncbi:unnamed protein product, partial [marine sediment metagenome]
MTVNDNERFDVLIIGDGYGFLSSLLKSLYPNSKITLIDIGKVLLFPAVNLQIIHPHCNHTFIDSTNLNTKNFDFLYVPAENIWNLNGVKYKLIITISAMQEMNYETINNYFRFMRLRATEDNLFYCSSR